MSGESTWELKGRRSSRAARNRRNVLPDRPEYAFIGRSNVGKSSLLNMLVGRNRLAKTSAPRQNPAHQPFDVDDTWYLVDLPGFGYAKVSKKDRVKWMKVTKQYLDSHKFDVRDDARGFAHPRPKGRPRIHGLDGWSGVACVGVHRGQAQQGGARGILPAYEQVMLRQWHKMPPLFVTSGNTGEGREEVLRFIAHQRLKALSLRIQSRQCAWRTLL